MIPSCYAGNKKKLSKQTIILTIRTMVNNIKNNEIYYLTVQHII